MRDTFQEVAGTNPSHPPNPPSRRVDLLQHEHDHGRLSAGALAAGRALEDVFAAAQRSGGAAWGERVDTSFNGDASAANVADAARHVDRAMERVARLVGPVDARLVRRILAEGFDYAGVAAFDGRSGTRAVSYTAQRFRDALEELGEASKVVGARSMLSHDKYHDIATTHGI